MSIVTIYEGTIILGFSSLIDFLCKEYKNTTLTIERVKKSCIIYQKYLRDVLRAKMIGSDNVKGTCR